MTDGVTTINSYAYKPVYFQVWELVPKDTYLKYGGNSFMFFNPNALRMIDDLREFLDVPLIINNWKEGGTYEFSGLRPKSCSVGAEYSQHRLGQAFDVKPLRMPIGDAFKRIIDNITDERLKYISTIEDIEFTPTWLHVACPNIPDRIRIVKP